MATIWLMLLGVSLVIPGSAAGTWTDGRFLVAADAGLASPDSVIERPDARDTSLVKMQEVDGSVLRSRDCEPTRKRHAATIAGSTEGERGFRQPVVGTHWTFALEPAPYGWDMRLLDHDGLDLSQITPPYRLAPNPRELYGWHFRNATNTGPNIGDMNAPQQVRAFQFSLSLTGTGGFKPSAPFSAPDETQGQGLLTIRDMELSDFHPGTWFPDEIAIQ